jgi:hypothetical protein
MTNQESEHRRIVVETPTARREEVHSESVNYPERRGGVSSAALAAIVIGVVALAAIIVLFVINQQQTAVNDNTTAAQQQPPQTIVQQPAPQQPPIIVQQPAPATQPAPAIINGQSAPPAGSTTTSGSDDSMIQTAVDKKFSDDPKLSALGVTATVMNGKVTLMGSVQNAADKSLVERVVRNVKGVKSVDNQITVSGE